jgi:hypothetical protein
MLNKTSHFLLDIFSLAVDSTTPWHIIDEAVQWRHDTQHNYNQHDETKHNDIQHNDEKTRHSAL